MLQSLADHQRAEEGGAPSVIVHPERRLAGRLVRTLAAILLAPALPPLSVFIACGRDARFYISLFLAVVAYGVFQFLFAGPGLILWALGVLYAVACAARAVWPRRALGTTE